MSSPMRVMTKGSAVGKPDVMQRETVEKRSHARDELMDGVDRVRDVLLANAAKAEEDRTLPIASVEAMRAENLFAIAAPEAVGGLEVDPLTHIEVIEAVTRIDTSAGWTLMIGAQGVAMIATTCSEEACDRLFGGERWPISASQISPLGGSFKVVPGGFEVSGHWSFASGIRHAEWAMLTALEAGANGDGPPRHIGAVIPRDQVEVHDNWNVAGLKGTGSCDYLLENQFVPDEMAWPMPPELRRGGPRYTMKAPLAMLAAFALGASWRSLDEIALQARSKIRPGATGSVAVRPAFHKEIGEADSALRAARASLFEVVGQTWDLLRAGEPATEELQMQLIAAPPYTFDVSRRVVTTALRYGGSSALYLDNVLQRNFRDLNAAGQNILASERNYEVLGRWLVGVDPAGA